MTLVKFQCPECKGTIPVGWDSTKIPRKAVLFNLACPKCGWRGMQQLIVDTPPTVRFSYHLQCNNKHCSHCISLPLPIPSEMHANRVPWCRDGKSHNFVCPACWHVYEYTVADVQTKLDETPDPMGDSIDLMFVIETKCGKQSCVAPLYILHTGHESQLELLTPAIWLQEPTFGIFRCSGGHYVQTASVPGGKMTPWDDWTWLVRVSN